jgi:hypothetical protein
MVPYSSPRSVSVGIVLHRNDGRTPDYVSKDKRHKPQGRWRLRRLFASDCFDLHRIAPEVRETGVEPARVSPLDPKCRKFTFLLHRAHRTFGWQPLIWQRETTNRHWCCPTSEWALDVPKCVRSVSGLLAGFSVQRTKHGIAFVCILMGHSSIAFDPRQPTSRILLHALLP